MCLCVCVCTRVSVYFYIEFNKDSDSIIINTENKFIKKDKKMRLLESIISFKTHFYYTNSFENCSSKIHEFLFFTI